MKNFVGIDLGTTNSAICSYDGSDTRVWKSPEQNDVTPSVIYIDKRGNKYVGKRAYDSAPQNPDNAAMLFKRLMGTSTPIHLSAVNQTKTPEECSAEVLKVLFGYLPEEIRNNPDTGTVITVPAAFNQMQKDATMQAASMAGLGMVALMQEPVAAVMSVMRTRIFDGIFLIYDLGGGTLDVAIAESISGRGVTLLSNDGIAMCGGRDFGRALVDNIIRPWLLDNFNLPDDFSTTPQFKPLIRLAAYAAERAKIELSAREESVISLSEADVRIRDVSGNEIYFDIPLKREIYDKLISERIDESIAKVRETLDKTGMSSHDLERIVFIGGPTNYKPLRDKVAFELGVPGSIDINPMTAVAEGASLFAESIDWTSNSRQRKNTRGQVSSGKLALTFNYNARTPDVKAKIVAQLADEAASGFEFQIDSIDTGWTSGRLPLKHGASIDVTLTKNGDNSFKIFVFDSVGGPISLEQDRIIIIRTAATVNAIPASHSIAVEALDKLGGRSGLDYLIRASDALPKKGKKVFKAGESLKAGSTKNSFNFKLWEGEIEDPITDNRPIGVLKISGADFDEGVIPVGADLEFEYEILDSGNIKVEVSVPCIGGTFNSNKNFYSRQEGQYDYTTDVTAVIEEGEKTLDRLNNICDKVDDPKLNQARQKLEAAVSIDQEESDTEKSQEAMEKILEARRLLAQVRKEHLKVIRQIELDNVTSSFDKEVRKHARPSEESSFDNQAKTAQRSIDKNDRDFEHHINEMRSKSFGILWRQDWFVIDHFNFLIKSPVMFTDKQRFEELVERGEQLKRADDIEKLRIVVIQLYDIRRGISSDDDIMETVNIIRE